MGCWRFKLAPRLVLEDGRERSAIEDARGSRRPETMTFRCSWARITLSSMTIQSGKTARQLCMAADEALTEAAFRTGEFTEAERLFGEAPILAERDGDREAEAPAAGGLGMTHHYRNIAKLVGGLAPADADVAAEEDMMRRALAIWQQIGDPAGTARALLLVDGRFPVRRPLGAIRLRQWDPSGRLGRVSIPRE